MKRWNREKADVFELVFILSIGLMIAYAFQGCSSSPAKKAEIFEIDSTCTECQQFNAMVDGKMEQISICTCQ